MDHYSKCLVSFFSKAAYFVYVSSDTFSMSYFPFSVRTLNLKLLVKLGTLTSLKVVFNNKIGKIDCFC